MWKGCMIDAQRIRVNRGLPTGERQPTPPRGAGAPLQGRDECPADGWESDNQGWDFLGDELPSYILESRLYDDLY